MSYRHSSSTHKVEHEGDNLKFDDTGFIQIRYTDLLGRFLARYFQTDNEEDLDDFFRYGVGLDGSSVKGFARIDESDMLLIPDKSTLRVAPRLRLTIISSNFNMATVIADVYRGFGLGRLMRDPRYVSQRMEEYLAQKNLSCQVGSEVECFIFDDVVFQRDNGGKNNHEKTEVISAEQYGVGKYPIRRKGGYDAPPFQDSLLEFRFEVAKILKKNYSIKVTNLNHEVASSGQIEINFMHSTLTKAADNVQIYKDVIRNMAKQYNKVANFMPKPIFEEEDSLTNSGDNGSGMHVSISLWNKSSNSKNIFYDDSDGYAEISQEGRYFIGGVLNHASSLAAIVAPTINSYQRIVPGFEAPVYVAWARANRSAVIRIPVNEKNNFKSKRIEFRAPDPSSNPYLAFSAIVAAGLDGVKKKMDPGDPVNENIYKMSDSKRKSLGIKSLPHTLTESLQALKSDSDYLKLCFHPELLETYFILKQDEIDEAENHNSKTLQFRLYYDI
ncbi:MAG: type I glutamate--ammonia ligase [Nitrososphaeraceae archaeon]